MPCVEATNKSHSLTFKGCHSFDHFHSFTATTWIGAPSSRDLNKTPNFYYCKSVLIADLTFSHNLDQMEGLLAVFSFSPAHRGYSFLRLFSLVYFFCLEHFPQLFPWLPPITQASSFMTYSVGIPWPPHKQYNSLPFLCPLSFWLFLVCELILDNTLHTCFLHSPCPKDVHFLSIEIFFCVSDHCRHSTHNKCSKVFVGWKLSSHVISPLLWEER